MTQTEQTTVFTIDSKEIDVALTLGSIIAAKPKKVDIGDLENGPVSTMFVDREVLGNVAWAIHERRFVEAGIATKEEFFDLADSETLKRLDSAMRQAVSDFFPWGPQVVAAVSERVEGIKEAVEAMEMTEMDSGQPSGDALGSSESTPVSAV